jgi:hypothetical protein
METGDKRMTIADTQQFAGFTIEMHYDEHCFSPRDNDCNTGLFLGLPHQHYNIGDEQLPQDLSFPCDCTDDGEPFADCNKCSGAGEVSARNLTDLRDLLKIKYQARVILPVGMIDHSGVSYYIGGGAHWCDPGGWDSGTCGFILTTPERIAERWGEDPVTDEVLEQALTSEIEEYDRWARGDCYGFIINGPDGNEIDDSCWGFIGYEYALSEARETLQAYLSRRHKEREALYRRLIADRHNIREQAS